MNMHAENLRSIASFIQFDGYAKGAVNCSEAADEIEHLASALAESEHLAGRNGQAESHQILSRALEDKHEFAEKMKAAQAQLAENDALFEQLKTNPACVRANMLRGQIAMLFEVEGFPELQKSLAEKEKECQRLRDACEKIRSATRPNGIADQSSCVPDHIAALHDIARDALANKEGK